MKVFGADSIVATRATAPLTTNDIVVQICPCIFLSARHPNQATIAQLTQVYMGKILLVTYCPAKIKREQAKAIKIVWKLSTAASNYELFDQ